MKITNPIKMNDWEIKNFLLVVLSLQLALWGAIGLDTVELQIPVIRQFIGFVYLIFIPGITIFRILKLHKLGDIETILYTVGLSTATLMFIGLFMNTIYPLLGISRPLSLTPLVITISVVVLILCVLCYIRDRGFSDPSYIDVKDVLSPPAMFLWLIPSLAVFGTHLMNFYYNNILLMFLVVIIALIAVLVAFDKFITKNLYPLAIFVIAISLLYHKSLISTYLCGCDIQTEYYFSNLVKMNAVWDSTIPSNINAMLSITILMPIYSIVTNMAITWIFKIVCPILFSLVPLGLYCVFRKQTNDKIAFLSCFFFVSIHPFYCDLTESIRQQIAELFLVLLILVIIDRNMDKMKRSFLFIVFGASLAVSHYGVSYIYMFCLISAWLILVLAENPEIQKLINNLSFKFGKKGEEFAISLNPLSAKNNRTISSTFVLIFISFTLAWYMYVSSSSAFNTIVQIGNHIASSIFTDFLNPAAAEGLDIILKETLSPLHNVTKYLHLLSQFFIFVGVIALILKREGMKFEREYAAFSLMNFVICVGGIALPYFASALNVTRLYHVTLVFLAPFCVIGGITVFKVLSRVVMASWTEQRVRRSSLRALSVFFAVFLLFNSGWVYELAKDNPTSIALNNTIDYSRFNDREFYGANWLGSKSPSSSLYYADGYGRLLLYEFVDRHFVRIFWNTTIKIQKDSYVYFRSLNTNKKEMVEYGKNIPVRHISLNDSIFFNTIVSHQNRICLLYTSDAADE